MNLSERWQSQLARLREQHQYRVLTPPAGIDFSSNDYLGYSRLVHSLSGLSSSGTASRLLRGAHPIWQEVESRLARWHQAEAAVMMTSGYTANEGLLSTIVEPGDLVFSDRCNHASIIDGLRLSLAEKVVYLHNDLHHVAAEMSRRRASRPAKQAWFIVTESLFGMEGDVAPLAELADLAERYEAHLIVDEAHATGCFGRGGSGLVDALGLRSRVLATVHTGGKALAVPGAYIVSASLLKEILVNRCRHLIFTTALAPQIGSWWLEVLEHIGGDESARSRLHQRAGFFRAQVLRRGIFLAGSHYITSLILGEDSTALAAAQRLQQAGFDVRAIRPPTVPVGTARLRISIHADHEPAMLEEIAAALPPLAIQAPG
jgi:8-amino-7-oxononanoate synthase